MANTTYLDLIKPLGTDHALVAQINSNSDKIDAEAGKVRSNFAAPYSASSAYAVGELCTKDGKLYECNTPIGSGGEAWTAGHWTQKSVGEVTNALSQAIVGIRTHEAVSSSASDWDTAIENYADSLSNDGKCHIGFVQRPQAGIVMCIIQKFADASYASAVAYGYWRNPRFYRKDSGTWEINEIALSNSVAPLTFGTNTKSLTANLTDSWTTEVPNDGVPHLCTINAQYGNVFGYITRYSNNYGVAQLMRYDNNTYYCFLNNGTVTVKQPSYQS